MKALIIIDLQNDFLPGGALAVRGGDEIIPIINQLTTKFSHIYATQDWHPEHHISFASTHKKNAGETIQIDEYTQILWPDHCIQNTPGSALSSALDQSKIEKIFFKGIDTHIDSYSAFFDNGKERSTGLDQYLKERKITQLFFVGLTTEYCVKFSVLHALELSFDTSVIIDACRAVNLQPSDEKNAIKEMLLNGAHIINSSSIK